MIVFVPSGMRDDEISETEYLHMPASKLIGIVMVGLLVGIAASVRVAAGGEGAVSASRGEQATSIYDFTMKTIDGEARSLSEYKGKVLLIVNVASRCGYTPQYEGLQKLYESKSGAGFVVLAFPANDFGNQEPASNSEIAEFCSSKFGVTFPLFEKITVKGPEKHALYSYLSSRPEPAGGEPKWNFTKYLVDRSGNVVERYESKVRPDDPTLTGKIDELLASNP